jgi:hypothetical protein
MKSQRLGPALLAVLLAAPAAAHDSSTSVGARVSVAIEVEGRTTPLWAAVDGSARRYLEAQEGKRYAITLSNRGGERVGVVVRVDGLNVVSGERDAGRRGRMYVLDPWQTSRVQGWRTSLSEVRQFTFVDERSSYAARSGKANPKLGWIEVFVYRERRARWEEPAPVLQDSRSKQEDSRETNEAAAGESRARAQSAPAAPAEADTMSGAGRSYPGTGWGRRTEDRVVLVDFDPEERACEELALRYEYRPALVALGVLPRPAPPSDRLRERERAEWGFAQPPLW